MAIRRWDPLRDLVQLRETMNRMLDDALARSSVGGSESIGTAAWTPPLDLFEDAARYVLRADLPGVDSADLDIKVDDGRLTLRGHRNPDDDVEREAYLRIERPSGPFTLQLALPPSVDARQIEARHVNGVLEVVLPKRDAEATAKIDVAAG